MKWQSRVDVQVNRFLNSQTDEPEPQPNQAASATLRNVKTRAPWVPIETMYALAKNNASDQAIDAVGQMAGRRIIDKQAEPIEESWWERNVYGKLKTAARWTTAGMYFLPEYTAGAVAQIFDENTSVDGWFISTRLGTLVNERIDVPRYVEQEIAARRLNDTPEVRRSLAQEFTGNGFDLGKPQLELQAERARRYRGTVKDGNAFTLGRGSAQTVFLPGSKPYNYMSGLIDAIVAIYTDPTGGVVRGIRVAAGAPRAARAALMAERGARGAAALTELRAAGGLVPRLSEAQVAGLKGALMTESGMIPTLGSVGLDETAFARFWRSNWRAKRWAQRIADTTDVGELRRELPASIPNEMVLQFARAKTADEVVAVAAQGFTINAGGFADDIRRLQSGAIATGAKRVGGRLIEKTPLQNSKFLRSARRALAPMPDDAIIRWGDDSLNANAAITAERYLTGNGVERTKVNEIVGMWVEAFTAGAGRSARAKALAAFRSALDAAMESNGIAKEVREDTLRNGQRLVDDLRKYMVDRQGVTTDNGFAAAIADANMEYVPQEELELIIETLGRGDEMKVISPLALSELLNRVQVLPDMRNLRRLTSNPLFGGKFSRVLEPFGTFAGKTARREVTVVTDKEQYARLGEQLNEALTKLKDVPARGGQDRQLLKDQVEALRTARRQLLRTETRTVRTGEQRTSIALIDKLQNEVWKPMALMTGGYIMRNAIDAQVRMAFKGLPSVFTHPWEYLSLVMNQSKKRGLLGDDLRSLGVDDYVDTVREAMTFGLRRQGLTDVDIANHLRKTGQWAIVRRDDVNGLKLHTEAVAQNGYLVHGDPLQRLAMQTIIETAADTGGNVTDETIRIAVGRLRGLIDADMADNGPIFRELRSLFEEGLTVVDPSTGKVALLKVENFAQLDEASRSRLLDEYLTRVSIANPNMLTGGLYETQFAYAFNRVVAVDRAGKVVPPVDLPTVRSVPAETPFGVEPTGEMRVVSLQVVDPVETPRRRPYVGEGAKRPEVGTTVWDEETGTLGVVIRQERFDGTRIKSSELAELADTDVVNIVQPIQSVPSKKGVVRAAAMGTDDTEGVVLSVIRGGETVMPLTAFGKIGNGTEQFRQIVRRLPVAAKEGDVGLPPALKREVLELSEEQRGLFNRATDFFFVRMAGTASRVLDRSPVFRTYYYEEVEKYVDRLEPEEAQKVLDNLRTRINEDVADTRMRWVEDQRVTRGVGDGPENVQPLMDEWDAKNPAEKLDEFVGSKSLIRRLERSAKTGGDITAEQLDEFAKSIALQKTKELLYDASTKSNLEDALRIVMPFAPAWREIIGTYAHLFRESPLIAYRNVSRIVRGAQNADPDNDGRGFFYNDPVTNQLMFMFPGSGPIARVLTGLDAPLKAPAVRFSQGLQVFPALGPFAQVAASKLLGDRPETDKMVEILLPYGRKDLMDVTNPLKILPGWVQKGVEALRQDQGKMDTIYANTYTETLRANSASGKYDLSDRNQVRQLEADSRRDASWLTLMRAASQFIGPTAGSPEFKIGSENGDIYATELIKEFYRMQTEDYDSAVPKFLEMYGDDVALYVSSKSRSLVDGLEATEAFGDWERANGSLLDEYPEVAAYMAPAGDDFSFAVWDRQLQSGRREKLTDKQILDLSQERIGAAKYRWARLQIGPNPSPEKRQLLKQYRLALHQQYPAFPEVPRFEVGKFDEQVEQLKLLVADPRLAGNPIAAAVAQYLQVRDYARQAGLAQFGTANIRQAKALEPFKDKLANIGEMLVAQEPDFARIWDRLLSSEVVG
jgi:hypothetical protein